MIVNRALPQNITPDTLPYFEKELSKEINDHQVYDLENVFVTKDGVVYDSYFRLFKPSVGAASLAQSYTAKHLIAELIKRRIKRLDKNTEFVLCFTPWSQGYFHWFGDTLMKITAEKQYCKANTLLLSEKFNSGFYKESLDIIDNDFKLKFIQNNELVFVPRLKIIGEIAPTGNYNPSITQALRNSFGSKTSVPDKRIYISRRSARRRKVINEEALERILLKYNFEIVDFENKSLSDQIDLLQSSKYLVSIHGAGLTNMLFMKEKSKVLEFKLKTDYHNLCYFSLASALNHDYYFQLCDFEGDNNDTLDANFIVDPVEFEKNISTMINS